MVILQFETLDSIITNKAVCFRETIVIFRTFFPALDYGMNLLIDSLTTSEHFPVDY